MYFTRANTLNESGYDWSILLCILVNDRFEKFFIVQLREMQEKDWEDRPRIFDIKTWHQRPQIIKTVIIPSLFNKSEKEFEEVNPTEMIVKTYDGKTISILHLIEEFKKELLSHPVNKNIEKKITAPM